MMHSPTKKKQVNLRLLLMLPAVVLLLFLLNVSLGSISIPFLEVLSILIGCPNENEVWVNIIWTFRLPRAITATLAGAGLAVSGLQMQTLFRNPLAGPFVLGISSGASLGVALVVMAGGVFGGFLSLSGFGNWLLTLAAGVGASMVLFIVIAFSPRVRDGMALLVVGLMFGSLTSAVVGLLQFFSDSEAIQAYLIWTFGSLGGLNWTEISVFSPTVLLGLGISVFLIKPLNSLLLGERYAQSMGLRLKRARVGIVISTSLLAGSITAFCGPIAFIGLAVPHFARMVFDTSEHKVLIPAVALCGMVIMLVCDIIAQLPGSQFIMPINAITSIIGAPVVIWVILRKRDVKNAFTG